MKILSYSRVLKSSHISSWRQVISVAEIAVQLRALSLGSVFVVWAVFQLRWRKKAYLKRRPLFRWQIFKFCCDIQGSHLIGYLWVSLIIDQSECLICYFLCTELTLFCTELILFCTELPENCIYLKQSELSNFSMYIIRCKIKRGNSNNLNDITFKKPRCKVCGGTPKVRSSKHLFLNLTKVSTEWIIFHTHVGLYFGLLDCTSLQKFLVNISFSNSFPFHFLAWIILKKLGGQIVYGR